MNATATPARPPHSRGVVLMLVSTTCFTANVLLIRALGSIEPVDPWLISAVRFGMGLVVLALLFRPDVRLERVFTNGALIRRGIVGALGTCAFYFTIVHLGAGLATFIGNTYVIIAALMAVPMLGERLRPAVLVGGVAALGGIALLTDVLGHHRQPGLFELVAVLTAVASAYIVITIRQLHATEHTATIFAAQCVYGVVIGLAPVALHPSSASPLAWGVMLTAGACVAAGQLLMTRAFRDLPVAEGTLLQMLVPLGVALGGFAFFGERFAPSELTGAGLILAGTVFTAWKR